MDNTLLLRRKIMFESALPSHNLPKGYQEAKYIEKNYGGGEGFLYGNNNTTNIPYGFSIEVECGFNKSALEHNLDGPMIAMHQYYYNSKTTSQRYFSAGYGIRILKSGVVQASYCNKAGTTSQGDFHTVTTIQKNEDKHIIKLFVDRNNTSSDVTDDKFYCSVDGIPYEIPNNIIPTDEDLGGIKYANISPTNRNTRMPFAGFASARDYYGATNHIIYKSHYGRIYNLKIYNADNSIRYEYIPCIRKSDGNPGWYNIKNNAFCLSSYYSSGYNFNPKLLIPGPFIY